MRSARAPALAGISASSSAISRGIDILLRCKYRKHAMKHASHFSQLAARHNLDRGCATIERARHTWNAPRGKCAIILAGDPATSTRLQPAEQLAAVDDERGASDPRAGRRG